MALKSFTPPEDLRFAGAVIASWLTHLTLGTFYSWANTTPFVTSYMKWKGFDVNYEDTSRVPAWTGFIFGFCVYLGAKLQGVIGLRAGLLLGLWILSLSVGLSSITINYGLYAFLSTYACMFGVGMGLGYMAPIVCLTKWLPNRKGLAAGLVVFAFGSGGMLFDPIRDALVNPHDLPPTRIEADGKYYDWEDPEVVRNVLEHVPAMFVKMALLTATMQLLGTILLMQPRTTPVAPTCLKDELAKPLCKSDATKPDVAPGSTKPDPETGDLRRASSSPNFNRHATFVDTERQYGTSAVLKTRQFWLLLLNFMCNTQAVFFTNAFAKAVGSKNLPESDDVLTEIIAMGALYNGVGRIFWGQILDATSFQTAMMLLCAMQSTILIILPFCQTAVTFEVCLWANLLCVGGIFSLFPAATLSFFGAKNLGPNNGLLMIGFSIGMILGPQFAEPIVQHLSLNALSWTNACFVACGGFLAWLNTAKGL